MHLSYGRGMKHTYDFYEKSSMSRDDARRVVETALHGMDDGELFLEYDQTEAISFDDGRIRNASFSTSQGFGLRSVSGDTCGFAHANELSVDAIRRAGETVSAIVKDASSHTLNLTPNAKPKPLYDSANPIDSMGFTDKVALLGEIDAYLRSKDPRVKQVSASIVGNFQVVEIMRAHEEAIQDIRPLVRINISVVVEQHGRMESGSAGSGARTAYADYVAPERWRKQADEALRQALVNLDAKPAPAGELPVVLGPGWCGVLLHEAVGHGLEGDFNRKGTSTFSGRIGERVASKGVTVVDDGTMDKRRGSLTIDDEGTPSGYNVLIEDGILKGYMQDRMNARLMNMPLTGNGRRESYAHLPMPRMTNTYMLDGTADPVEMIKSVDKGIYAVHFGGGQVDITSGKFVFSASEAYMIEGGKVTHPVKGATLIGNGPDTMQKIKAIGNDLCLDDGVGTCGKAGQSVPVGVGQPSLLIEAMTIGGTEVA
jgi:TldD protein